MNKKFRWGILSTARIAQTAMVPALQTSELAEVFAVASRSEEKARRFAASLDIPRIFGDYQALLDDQDIDAIYIPLPNHLHKEWTIRCAEAGKHILCEKPLALNPEECQEMIEAADQNGVQLMESFMYRYHPRIKAARELVASKAIGQLRTIESAFTFRLDNPDDIRYQKELGGGALMDVGCYCVSISRLMAGREPITVQARAYWAPTGVDDQLSGLLDFGDGLIAHFDCALNQTHREHCTLAGTKGLLEIPNAFNPHKQETRILQETSRGERKVQRFTGVDEYRLIAEDFMLSIESGLPTYPIEDSIKNMRVIQALLTSAREDGQPIELS